LGSGEDGGGPARHEPAEAGVEIGEEAPAAPLREPHGRAELGPAEASASNVGQVEATKSEPSAPEPAILEASPAEPPRRRSTVREPVRLLDTPVPVTPASTPAEPTTVPVGKSAATDNVAPVPRRAGWWAKRLFGENK